MYDLLSSYGYRIDSSRKLIGYVTWEMMRDMLINFFTDSRIKPRDTLLFYYSGHGVPDVDGDVYFASSEIDPNLPYKRGISFNELAKMIQKTTSNRVVIILDCCYSGSAFLSKGEEEDKVQFGGSPIDNGSRIFRGEGRCLLASSQALQEAYVLEEKNHSLFTFYILRGLQGNEQSVFNNDGNITVDTLSKYVYEKIMNLPLKKRPKQRPLRKIESSGDIILVEKSCLPQSKKLSTKKEIKVEHPYEDILSKSALEPYRGRTKENRLELSPVKVSSELIDEYLQKHQRYVRQVAKQNSEAGRAFYFLEFIRNVFENVQASHPHELYPELEKYIASKKTVLIRGRIDAFLGNLIIEFESDLRKYKKNCELQLRKYTAILWNNKGKVNYLCVATDGLQFLIFRPRSPLASDFTEDSIELEAVDTFNIQEEDPIKIYKRLDRYILYRTLVPPTATDIVQDFGPRSIIFKDCLSLLKSAWMLIKGESLMVYQEWSKYLSIVYGNQIENEELFLRHTYLATLAKLMVFSFYQQNTLPTSEEIIIKILHGDIFSEWNIKNFLIEDFFSWIIRSKANKNGIEIAMRILDGLEVYDLTGLNEDVLKELYQQLVDPAERHDLGEFYTPDWLAEMMVKEVLKDPYCRILDPSCGSGTFLATVIRHKLLLLPDDDPSEKMKTIIKTVCGIDIHPLAVLISKSNYLMALGNLLTKPQGPIVIPVYLSDSIIFPLPTVSIATYHLNEPVYRYRVDESVELVLPKSLVDAELTDEILDNVKKFANDKAVGKAAPLKGFQVSLEKKYNITNQQFEIIKDTIDKLTELIKTNRDTIHPFILKNIYKPSVIGKFDILIGNPPWLSYRYITNTKRRTEINKLIADTYHLLDKSKENLITHMELATLFFARCSDFYLNTNGKIAFVLPRSIFSGDQHNNFRNNRFSPEVGFYLLFDLEKNQHERVSPLFSVESCVVFGEKNKRTGTR